MADAAPNTVPPSKQRDIQILVIAGILGIALGWFAATSPLSPIKPEPQRPVLRFLARVAKVGLWALMVADPPPAQHHIVHARVGEDGHKVLQHGEGW